MADKKIFAVTDEDELAGSKEDLITQVAGLKEYLRLLEKSINSIQSVKMDMLKCARNFDEEAPKVYETLDMIQDKMRAKKEEVAKYYLAYEIKRN